MAESTDWTPSPVLVPINSVWSYSLVTVLHASGTFHDFFFLMYIWSCCLPWRVFASLLLTWLWQKKSTLHSEPFPVKFSFQDPRWKTAYLFCYALIYILSPNLLASRYTKAPSNAAGRKFSTRRPHLKMKNPESSVTFLLKTGSKCFLWASLRNHRRRSRGGHGKVISRVSAWTEKQGEENESDEVKENLY